MHQISSECAHIEVYKGKTKVSVPRLEQGIDLQMAISQQPEGVRKSSLVFSNVVLSGLNDFAARFTRNI